MMRDYLKTLGYGPGTMVERLYWRERKTRKQPNVIEKNGRAKEGQMEGPRWANVFLYKSKVSFRYLAKCPIPRIRYRRNRESFADL